MGWPQPNETIDFFADKKNNDYIRYNRGSGEKNNKYVWSGTRVVENKYDGVLCILTPVWDVLYYNFSFRTERRLITYRSRCQPWRNEMCPIAGKTVIYHLFYLQSQWSLIYWQIRRLYASHKVRSLRSHQHSRAKNVSVCVTHVKPLSRIV